MRIAQERIFVPARPVSGRQQYLVAAELRLHKSAKIGRDIL